MNSKRHIILYGMAALAIVLIVGAAATVRAIQDDPYDDSFAPEGIHPRDATALVDPEKRASWEAEYDRLILLTQTAGTPRVLNTPPPRPARTLPPLPDDVLISPNPTGSFVFSNGWQGIVGDYFLHVYAGVERYIPGDPGVVVVKTFTTDRVLVSEEIFRPQTPFSKLAITREEGGQFWLADNAGQTIIFDLSSRQFLPDDTTPTPLPVETGTPAPAETVVGGAPGETAMPQ